MTEPLLIHVHAPYTELGKDLMVTVDWNAPTPPREILVSLHVEVEGRGNDHEELVMSISIPATELTGSAELAFPLHLALTPTYYGELFEVGWKIRARMDLRRQRDAIAEHRVKIAPSGWLRANAQQRQTKPAPADRPVNDLPIINPYADPWPDPTDS